MNKFKKYLIFVVISFFCLLKACVVKEEHKKNQLLKIIESDIIENNNNNFIYIDKRNKDILIYSDSLGVNYFFDMNREVIISIIKGGKQEVLSKKDEVIIKNKIKLSKKKMDRLKIKSIYPGKKVFNVETNILSDSTYEMLSKFNKNYKDINYNKNRGDYFFGLINFENTSLNSKLINEYKKDFNLQKLDSLWYYYRFQK